MFPVKVFVFGMTAVLANAFGMGLGDFASQRSQKDFIERERMRQQWQMQHNMDSQKKEMEDIYVLKGISREDAKTIVDNLANSPQCFLDIMMMEELGYNTDDSSPALNGLVTFFSFLIFGIVPILPYVVAKIKDDNIHTAIYFWMSLFVGGGELVLLGGIKSMFGVTQWKKSALQTLTVGMVAMVIGYAFGSLFDKPIG